MIPACPNNLLPMALVFWCAAFGATIDEAGVGLRDRNQSKVIRLSFTFRPSHHDSNHDGSTLPCHNISDGGGNCTFDNRTGNATVPGVKPNKTVSEVALQFLTSSMSTIIIPSFYMAVCLLSVPANICALLVFLRRIKPLNPAVIYMLNLASADLLFAMVLPFKIFYHFKGNDWIFGKAMCRLVTTAFEWNMYCSILLITLISVDRLLSVVYPMDSLSWRSPRKAFISCAAMWVLSFVGSVHNLFTEQNFRVPELDIITCHDIQPSQPLPWEKIYYITLCLFLFFLPLIITVVSYTRVIITLNKDQPGVPGASGRKRRAAMLTTTVLVMFVLCFMPTNIIQIIHQVMFTQKQVPENQLDPDRLYVVYSVFLCLGSLNCVLDPLVYFVGSTQFQKEVCSMLMRGPSRAPAEARHKLVKAIQSIPLTKQIQNLTVGKIQISTPSNSDSTKVNFVY